MLTAARVTIADDGDGVTLSARELRLSVALGPLIAGRVDAQELVLHGPVIHLPWPPRASSFTARPPAWLGALSARVEDGTLIVGALVFTGINAVLQTADTGTLSADGTGARDGLAWHFNARLARPGGDGAAGLDIALDGQGKMAGTGGRFTGQLAAGGEIAGQVVAYGPDLSLLLATPKLPFRAEGRLLASGGLLAAEELAVELGGSPGRAAFALRVAPVQRLDVALTASRIDLDAWLPVLLRGPAPSLPMGLDLSAEAAGLAGGTIGRLRAAFDLRDGAVELRDGSAVLPGQAQLRLSGQLARPPGEHPHADGRARLTAPDLRTTLAWLDAAGLSLFGPLPANVLRSAELSARLTAEPGQGALDDLAGRVDGSALTGHVTLRPGVHPSVEAALVLDRLALDPWLPGRPLPLAEIPRLLGGLDADLQVQAKRATLRGVPMDAFSLDGAVHDGQLTLRLADATALSVHLSLSGTVGEGGRIGEGRLDVAAPSARALAALLPDLMPGAAIGLPGVGAAALWRSPVAVQVLASGPPDALEVRLGADLADARLEAQPVFNLPGGSWAGPVTLRHPGAPRLLETLGLTNPAAWLGDGSLSLVSQVVAGAGRIAADNFDLTAGSLHATGQLVLEHDLAEGRDVPRLSGRVTAETLPLPLPYAGSPDPWPMDLLRGWQAAVHVEAGQVLAGQSPILGQAVADLRLGDGVLAIDKLSAKLADGTFTGSATLDAAATPPALRAIAALSAVHLSDRLADMQVDLAAGTVDAHVLLTAAGYSPAALVATLGGTLTATVHGGVLAGIDLAQIADAVRAAPANGAAKLDASLRNALSGGSTGFETLSIAAQASGGSVTLGATTLTSDNGGADFSGSIDLPRGELDLRMLLRPAVSDPPDIGLRLTGPASAPRRTPELAGANRWLAEHPAAQ